MSNIGGVTKARRVKYFKQRETARFSNNFFVARFQKVARWRKKYYKMSFILLSSLRMCSFAN